MDSKKFLMVLGEKIRAIRKAKKISQERLADLSGLHPTYISDIERGKVNASVYTIYAVANALNTPFSELASFSSSNLDQTIEYEIAGMLGSLRRLGKKKQALFLSSAKGLISGIEKA